jgi:aryl carrier-like protein
VQTFLVHFLCRELQLTAEQIQPHRNLRDYGVDSITAMRLMRAVERDLHVPMSGRDLLQHQTLYALSTCLAARMAAAQPEAAAAVVTPTAADALELFQQGILTLEAVEAMLEQGKMV